MRGLVPGMSVSTLRYLLCWVMAVIFPVSLMAADTASAMLHTQGGVWLNGNEAADSTAVLVGDVLETKAESRADLSTDGSTVLIQPESVVKFQGDFLVLDHGRVLVATSKNMSVHVNCIVVEPASSSWTQYEVTDVNGRVVVAAHKSDVNIKYQGGHGASSKESGSSGEATVHEGEEASREESDACGAAKKPISVNNPLNTKWIEIGGGGAGGVLALCLLLCTGKKPPKISPDAP